MTPKRYVAINNSERTGGVEMTPERENYASAPLSELLRHVCHEAADKINSLTAEIATLRARLDALVTAGEGKNYQTPDTVGGFRYLLVYDSGDTWGDDGYCYSREADRIMDRNEAEKQFSTRPAEERPELYALIPIKQYDALAAAIRKTKELK